MDIRRIHFVKERILAEAGRTLDRPISRAAALVCLANPFAGGARVDDLSPLFDAGRDIGRAVMEELTGLRDGIGGGKAIIPSNCKVGAAATQIDVPLGEKDDVWSFDHFDTMTVGVPDAPRPDEIVVIAAVADGGRPLPRVGSGPLPE